MLGLFGQQAAYALGPDIVKPIGVEQTMQSPMPGMAGMDCDRMMASAAQPAHHDGGTPCKGMSLACIAAMGCTIPIVLGTDPMPAISKAVLAPVTFWATSPRFVGRSYAPDPEPPAHLS